MFADLGALRSKGYVTVSSGTDKGHASDKVGWVLS